MQDPIPPIPSYMTHSLSNSDKIPYFKDTDFQVDDLPEEEHEEERTSTIVIAEESHGLVVWGDGAAIANLVVQPGVSHVHPLSSFILMFFCYRTIHMRRAYATPSLPRAPTPWALQW